MNKTENLRIPLYGAVTTGAVSFNFNKYDVYSPYFDIQYLWRFFKYDATQPTGQQVSRSAVYTLEHTDLTSIAKLASILAYICLKTFSDSCNVVMAAWAAEARACRFFIILKSFNCCWVGKDITFDFNYQCDEKTDAIVGDTLVFLHDKTHTIACSVDGVNITTAKSKSVITSKCVIAQEGRYTFFCSQHSKQTVTVTTGLFYCLWHKFCNMHLEDPNSDYAIATQRATTLALVLNSATAATSPAESATAFALLPP